MLTLFDFDGTLSNTQQAIIAGLRTLVSERLDDPPGDDVLLAHVQQGMSLHATIRSLHPEPATIEHEIDVWASHYRTAYGQYSEEFEQLYDGALESVMHANQIGTVVIVSMKHRDELERSIARLGLAPFVSAFFGDDDQAPLKPDPALWHDVIRPMFTSSSSEPSVMIGDTGHDLHFAHNSGLKSCWASYGFGDAALCREIGFDAEVASAREIPQFLDQLKRG